METEPASKAISVIDQSCKLLKDTRKHGNHPSWPWLSWCYRPIYTLGGRRLLPQAAGSQRGCQHRGQRHARGRHRTAQWHRATSGLWWTGDHHLETWHELGSSKPMWGKKILSCLKLLFEVLPGRILCWYTGNKVLGGFWWRFLAYKSYTSVEETELSLPNPGDAIPVLHCGFKDCPVWCRLKGQRGADDWKSVARVDDWKKELGFCFEDQDSSMQLLFF